ncbi:uncharacterized protein (TIGR03382 family) [Leptothrix sp. C29]|uniref:Uncharacterized protein (TIGR03382 family) n=1 Tax=Sphaerotilus uruguayifluvii TaxID=2735897 RepID=A0ABX2G9C2_9BURK|nr:uncharacterized protein (TIGR03382 family) [Leptothrix sp. C29]
MLDDKNPAPTKDPGALVTLATLALAALALLARRKD